MSLQEARQQVAADLQEVGLNVRSFIPAKVTPPIVIMGTGDPYVEQGNTYDPTQFVCHLELFVIAGTSDNEAALGKLEAMIETVIFNLGDWHIDGVSSPFMATANDGQYLTSRISISNTITIEGGTE